MPPSPFGSKAPGERPWRVVEGERLRWRCWGGDYVVFNPSSGQTHLLDVVTGRILTELTAGSRNLLEMRSDVARFLEVADDERLGSTITDILIRLEEAGLIERMN
jgi:PqqD family protein of HPr-rel-A system